MDKEAALIIAAKDLFLEGIKHRVSSGLPTAASVAEEFIAFYKKLEIGIKK